MGLTGHGRGDTLKRELVQLVVILGHGSFSLVDGELDMGLVVVTGSEDLRPLGGDDSSLMDNLRVDSTFHLKTERKGGGIDDNQFLLTLLSTDDSSLDGSTIGDGFIRVDTSVGLLSIEEVLNQ